MKKSVCQYCGKPLALHQRFCDDHCASEYKQRTAKDFSKIKYFLLGVMIGVIILFIGSFRQSHSNVGYGMMIIGATLILLSMTTGDTVKLFGYIKSRIIGRIVGLFCIIFGIWIIGF